MLRIRYVASNASQDYKDKVLGVTKDAAEKAIYTTNVIESLNYSLRKITKTRAAFPTEEAAIKLLWLGLQNAAKKWTMPVMNWGAAMNQFAIMFEDRLQFPD